MNKILISILFIGMILSTHLTFAQTDRPGCKDHPLFTRMEEYYISDCEYKEFAAHEFIDPVTKKEVVVEGHYFYIIYDIKEELEVKKASLRW
ncbi:MAG: hypothetical protein N2511_01585 [Thermodesulfovibrionales bacterium]|nr:hypothetical protein [Thermodesulfovibrionales bacterium]